MPTIDTEKLSPEVSDKYSIVSNAFSLAKIVNAELDTYKNEPKDEINVIIGDDKVPDTFVPQTKLCRWSNEVNFSVRLVDTEVGQETVSTLADKIIWEKGNKKIEFYEYEEGEGGHKLVWYLKKKPKTNKVEFTIQSKSLDFFYQPPLTQEYQNGYSEEFQKEIVVTETQVKDLDGNVLVERPENIVGSYAVYHSTKGGMNDINGKDYKTGQAFYIYRSKITDSNGNWVWGDLKIDIDKGTYIMEIPQEFLDNAVYPIKSNETFGNTTGGTTQYALGGYIAGYTGTPASAGTVINIIAKVYHDADEHIKTAIYLVSDGSLQSPQSGITTAFVDGWETFTFAGPTVSAVSYYIVAWADSVLCYIYGVSGAGNGKYQAVTYGAWPETYTPSTSANSRSIYATYTPSGGGATQDWRDLYQIISSKSQIISENQII